MPSILSVYVSAIQAVSKRWVDTLQGQHQINSAISWSWTHEADKKQYVVSVNALRTTGTMVTTEYQKALQRGLAAFL